MVAGKRLGDIPRYENMPQKTGLCIMRGAQGVNGSKYNMNVVASLPDDQAVVDITEKKLYGN